MTFANTRQQVKQKSSVYGYEPFIREGGRSCSESGVSRLGKERSQIEAQTRPSLSIVVAIFFRGDGGKTLRLWNSRGRLVICLFVETQWWQARADVNNYVRCSVAASASAMLLVHHARLHSGGDTAGLGNPT